MTPVSEITKEWAAMRPYGGFDLIMVDPPWQFKLRSDKWQGKSPEAQYECQPLDWIKALPIRALASDNAIIWLWATNPMLNVAIDVLAAWDVRFTTAGHWVKRTKHGKLGFGTGFVLRCAGEPFLIGSVGAPKTTKSVRSVIEGPIRGHSEKPEEAYREAEKLMPEAKRIEVFSRKDRPGWSVWGDEVGKLNGPL